MSRRRAQLAAAAVIAGLATAPAARGALAPPVTIDGPSPAIVAVDGVALAQDGSGAVVYRKLIAGVAHVFVALEHGGAWSPGAAVDGAVAAPATASAVAASDGGRVAVVWIAGGVLYGAVHPAGADAFSTAAAIAPAVGVPALGMGVSGTAYVAYVSPLAGGGSNIDIARLDRLSSVFAALPGGSLNPAPVTLASSDGGPSLVVSADATAVIAWAAVQPDGGTHVFVRRASVAGPSPVLDDATVTTLGGLAGGSADSPAVGVAYDSSDAWVAMRETFGASGSRVVVSELLGDELRDPVFADSLGSGAAAASSASAPSLAVNGSDDGLLACALAPGGGVAVAALGSKANPSGWTAGAALGAPGGSLRPAVATALSAGGSGVAAYAPAAGGLDAQLFDGGLAQGAPLALSTAALGPVAGADGLVASADDGGDLVVAYVAGAPGALSVATQAIVPAPGAPRATGTQLWSADARPVLRWQAAADSWTPPSYSVYIDGRLVATTNATSYAVAAALRDGRHTWQVVAEDSLGQRASSSVRALLIDAAKPTVALKLAGTPQAGDPVSFALRASAPSGLRRVLVSYGDGGSAAQARSTHVYARPGRYIVTVTVTDRAGVSAMLQRVLTIS